MLKKLRENKIIKIVGNIIYALAFIIVVLILLAVAIQRFSDNNIAIGGFRIFYVASGSMLPEYEVGDVLISKEIDPKDIKIGDDITYIGEKGELKGKIVTHQVIDKRQNENGEYVFITKGTSNTVEDPQISENQIYGKIIYKVFTLSFLCKLLQNIYGFYFVVIVPLAIIVAKMIVNFIISRNEKEENEQNEENEGNDKENS